LGHSAGVSARTQRLAYGISVEPSTTEEFRLDSPLLGALDHVHVAGLDYSAEIFMGMDRTQCTKL
jgi:hypothetical protein